MGIALAFISISVACISIIVYKQLMQSGVSLLAIGLVESLTILVTLAFFINWKQFLEVNNIKYKNLLFSGLCQGLGTFSAYLALYYLDPATYSFLGRNQTTFSFLLGYFFIKERPEPSTWIFFIMLTIGSMLMCYSGLNVNNGAGLFFIFVFCFAFSLRSLFIKMHSSSYSLSVEIFCGFLFTLIFVFINIYIEGVRVVDIFPPATTCVTISSVSIISVLASSYFYMRALQIERMSMISSIRLFSPYIVTIIYIFSEGYKFNLINTIGMIIMTAGILVFCINAFAGENYAVKFR